MITNLEVYSSLATAPDLPLAIGVGSNDDPIHIRNIDGLGPVKADVNTSPYGSFDGEFPTGTSIGKRNIVLTLGFNPDWVTNTVESLREMLYGYFMSKQPVTLRFFRDNGPPCEIQGFTESNEPTIFSQDPEATISVICPLPDFIAVDVSTVTGDAAENPAETQFTVVGNVPTSIHLVVSAIAGASTYDGEITYEHKTLALPNDTFSIVGSVAPAASVIIDSKRGAKIAQNLLGLESTNILNSMTPDSTWPLLQPGTNQVRVLLEAGADPKPWSLTYYDRFGGL